MPRMTRAEFAALKRKPWSNAVPTMVGGIRFPSKTEARVFSRLLASLAPGEWIVRQTSWPLLSLAPGPDGKVLTFRPDFLIIRTADPPHFAGWSRIGAETWTLAGAIPIPHILGVWVRVIEAKSGRLSRDYRLRRDAFAAVFGPVTEWSGLGPLPWEKS